MPKMATAAPKWAFGPGSGLGLCSVVTGTATRLLMCIVTGHGLAIVGSVPEALQLIDDATRVRRQFVSGLARTRLCQ